MKKQKIVFTNMKIPTKKIRIFAFLLDLLFLVLIIGILDNIFLLLGQRKTTLGNRIMGITYLNSDGGEISYKRALIRYLLLFPVSIFLAFLINLFLGLFLGLLGFVVFFQADGFAFFDINPLLLLYVIGVLSINVREIAVECPTFIDKRLGIKRVYKKSN